MQAQEDNIIENQERKIAELTAELAKLKKPKKEKKPREPIDWDKVKDLAFLGGFVVCIIGALYGLIYLLEWQKVHTYEGAIVDTVFKVDTHSTITTSRNGKRESIANEDHKKYELVIAFTDEDKGKRQIVFSTSGVNDWYSVSPIKAVDYRDKLPFPEKYSHTTLFVGENEPYLGCKVKVYELRGAILNSNTLRGFVANASMCRSSQKLRTASKKLTAEKENKNE
ncbi:hypothetical protein KJ885_04680 [Patescibacteria group bacterium]|nr:hypothetical protein [Patescibacteria group bacterium]